MKCIERVRSNEYFDHLNIEKTPLFNIRSSLPGGQLALIWLRAKLQLVTGCMIEVKPNII